jgi:Cu/Ag efflux protein CusF
MLRKFVCALFALALCVGVSLADEAKGKIKSVDNDKKTLTVTVNDKDVTYTLADDVQVVNAKGAPAKDQTKAMKSLKEGVDVTVTTEKKDGKDVVTKIQPAARKKDK